MTPDAHLLIVDDDERIRSLLQKFLIRNGFLVSAASDAGHARRIMSGLDFDLIIMDQGLPIMDGLTVLGWFKEKCIAKKVKTIPVLMLSAYDREFFKAGSLEEKGVT